jgi:hopanoid C-3 methylase
MKLLFVHPGPLLYTNVFLRLEPLGLELVAEAARRGKHAVRLIDLQAESQDAYHRIIAEWRPEFIAFSCNYLANVPEIVDLAVATKIILPRAFICVGGHSASFIAETILEHGEGAVDCVLKGEGEANIIGLLEAVAGDVNAISKVPGAVTANGSGPRRGSWTTLTTFGPRATSLETGANISSGCWTPALRSNFRAAVRGIVRFAALGLFMAAAIAI